METDKAVVNVPSPITGTIRINMKEGSTLHLGDTLAWIGTPDELKGASAAPAQPQPQQASSQQKPQPQPQPQKKAVATPAVRKLAHDLNIDISKVAGTGPNGRILENDVRGAASSSSRQTAPQQKNSEVLEEAHGGEVERLPMSTVRKAIAKNMEESWKKPRAGHMDLINATELFNLVGKEKPKVQKEQDVHLTFLPFIIKAAVEALKKNPHFNASYDHEKQEIIVKKYYNIGLAAESPDGLKVVVVKGADKKSAIIIAKEIESLHKRVQENTVTIEEMRDSTITITNIGSLGGGFLSVPMINPPDVAILGVHSIPDWPFVVAGGVEVGKVLPFSITFDHRVVDGAEAVKFGNAIKEYLEDPEFLEML